MRIVFFGDSITAWFPFTRLLPDRKIINTGIPGDTSGGLINRLTSSVFEHEPDKLFLWIGVNDLMLGVDPKQAEDNIAYIIDKIQERLPNCHIYLISILPISDIPLPQFYPDRKEHQNNLLIIEENKKLKQIASEKWITFIDAHSSFIVNGQINPDYTKDGLHLSRPGYIKMAEILQPYIDEE